MFKYIVSVLFWTLGGGSQRIVVRYRSKGTGNVGTGNRNTNGSLPVLEMNESAFKIKAKIGQPIPKTLAFNMY